MSFKRLDQEDIVVSAEGVVSSAWTGNTPTLVNFFTSSVQAASTMYVDVYQADTTTANSEVQFSIAYCDKKGSGSSYLNNAVPGVTPTLVNFSTYRNLINGDEDVDLNFGNDEIPFRPEYFYALNIDRSRYKEKLLPGSFTLKLSGSGGEIELRDSSVSESVVRYSDAGRVYNVVKTSNGYTGSAGPSGTSGSWGLFLPDIGTILLSGPVLDIASNGDGGIGLGTSRSTPNTDSQNQNKLYAAISRSADFTLGSEETLSSNFVFVRTRNSEFNYSTNPSYITGSGELRHDIMIDDPRAYFTTVGLYNDNNDLLAVAKLSRPLLKDSRKEALVRIKLDY
jgi:hypothetical protein